jgi:hypothetical protein
VQIALAIVLVIGIAAALVWSADRIRRSGRRL